MRLKKPKKPKKPLLIPLDRIKSIEFCKRLIKLRDDQINNIIFSDESNLLAWVYEVMYSFVAFVGLELELVYYID